VQNTSFLEGWESISATRTAMNPTEQIKMHLLCLIKDRKWSWHWHGILRALQTGVERCV
jgi:hypothetical protein